MKNIKVSFITQAAAIAAIYTVLTLVFAPISYGEVQVRIAEALTILPAFTPAAIPGLFIGCLISNTLGGSILLDVFFGSIATLLGAAGTWMLRKNRWLAPLPPIVSNTVIVPLVLKFGYGVPLPLPLLMVFIAIGEIISCYLLGELLLTVLTPYAGILLNTEDSAAAKKNDGHLFQK
ncbi:MAG: QueT transporter family protein [Lachnospiraceae bacterium]|nr:QueT transporter family protein [Lachnospiraceae bacterium]